MPFSRRVIAGKNEIEKKKNWCRGEVNLGITDGTVDFR